MGCVDEPTDELGRINFEDLAGLDFLFFRATFYWSPASDAFFEGIFVTVSFDTTLLDE